MFTNKEIEYIRNTIENGNNILIRKSRNDILILEQRTRTLSKFDKDRQLSEKEKKENVGIHIIKYCWTQRKTT